MESHRCPTEIDVVEILFGCGEIRITEVASMTRDQVHTWRIVGGKLLEGVATLWVMDPDSWRELQPWEINAVLRHRLQGSGEVVFADAQMMLRAGRSATDAYQREFGEWFYKRFTKR